MTRFILRWAISAAAIFLAIRFVPGITLQSGWVSVIWLALIFGLLNAFIRPLLSLLTCPLIILTLGLFIAHLHHVQGVAHGQQHAEAQRIHVRLQRRHMQQNEVGGEANDRSQDRRRDVSLGDLYLPCRRGVPDQVHLDHAGKAVVDNSDLMTLGRLATEEIVQF